MEFDSDLTLRFENVRLQIAIVDIAWRTAIENLSNSVQAALAAADRAVNKAEEANTKRFDSVNEFRASLSDQQRTLMPRNEVEVTIRGIIERLDLQNRTIEEQNKHIVAIAAGKTGTKEGWGWAVGVISLIFLIFSLIALMGRFK